jgi:hypothetical protein
MDSSFVTRVGGSRQRELLLFNKFLAAHAKAFSGGALWQKCE